MQRSTAEAQRRSYCPIAGKCQSVLPMQDSPMEDSKCIPTLCCMPASPGQGSQNSLGFGLDPSYDTNLHIWPQTTACLADEWQVATHPPCVLIVVGGALSAEKMAGNNPGGLAMLNPFTRPLNAPKVPARAARGELET
jgi:hypothetical protein